MEKKRVKQILSYVLLLWIITNIFGLSIRKAPTQVLVTNEVEMITGDIDTQTPKEFSTTTTTVNLQPQISSDYREIYDYDINTLLQNIANLVIDDSSIYIGGYERSEFGGWTDPDKDCQNTRHEILIRTSQVEVVFSDSDECRVIYGLWYDPYTNKEYEDAYKDIEIDHFVPLKNAYISGAHEWSEERKKEYSTYTSYEYHLLAVNSGANSDKSAKGPEEWLPVNTNFHCAYINIWVEIKIFWELSVTTEEFTTLDKISKNC
jgi:hypothetical protein